MAFAGIVHQGDAHSIEVINRHAVFIQVFLQSSLGSSSIGRQTNGSRFRSTKDAWRGEGGRRNLSTLGHIVDQALAIDGLGESGTDTDIVKRWLVVGEAIVVGAGGRCVDQLCAQAQDQP